MLAPSVGLGPGKRIRTFTEILGAFKQGAQIPAPIDALHNHC